MPSTIKETFSKSQYADLELQLFFKHHELVSREILLIPILYRLSMIIISCATIFVAGSNNEQSYIMIILAWSVATFWSLKTIESSKKRSEMEDLLLTFYDESPDKSLYAKLIYLEKWKRQGGFNAVYREPIFWGVFISLITLASYI